MTRQGAALFIMLLAAAKAQAADQPYPGPIVAEVVRVIDADTIRARARVWPTVEILATVRLRGVDTPERGRRARCKGERAMARMATDYVRGLLPQGTRIRLHNVRLGKYAGRVIADVRVPGPDGEWASLSELLIAGGYGRPYDGGHRRGWCSARSAGGKADRIR